MENSKKRTKILVALVLILITIAIGIAGIIATRFVVENYITANAAQYVETSASTTEDGRFQYKELSDGTIEISKYVGTDTVVTIPSTIDGKSVTSIGSSTFSGFSSITSVEIPESVINIGTYTFFKCNALTSIKIPKGVTSIKSATFMYCANLASVEIPEGITDIADKAFYGCSALTSIEIPEKVTSIGSEAFYGCSSLTSIKIPEGLTSIESHTFSHCSGLASMEIPEKVTKIGSYAFGWCTGLTSIEMSKNVTNIGNGAFYSCESLTSMNIPEGVTTIDTYTFGFCRKITNIQIPSSITSIGDNAFYCCNSLKSIKIPEGVTYIGKSAFDSCSSLTSIQIPSTVTNIGEVQFSYCSSLKEITVTDNNENFVSVDGVLFNKEKTKIIKYPSAKEASNYQIPGGVTSIGDGAFYGCKNLTSVYIPNGVTSIGDKAFADCVNLANINLPKGITTIESWSFAWCDALLNIEIPEGVTSIEEHAFYGCENLANVEIPSTVTSIGGSVFYASKLTTVELPENLTYLGGGVFDCCSKLTSIELPKKITSIGFRTFYGCTKLTDIKIPEEVTAIEKLAFGYCEGLTKIEIPEAVTTIGDDAFIACTNLKEIDVAESNQKYASEEGVLFNKEKTELITYPAGKEDAYYEISKKVTKIGNNAFDSCDGLNNILITNNVISIGKDAFKYCDNVTICCRSNSIAEEYAISNNIPYIIDDEAPTIGSISGNPSSWIKDDVTLTIIGASDSIAGLSDEPYSFDGGETWQAENTKTYEENITGIVIQVRDKLDNIYIHEEISITKIDKVPPTIASVEGNPEEWTKEDVTLTINGAEDVSAGLAEIPYSFDGGETWQAENTKTYEENTSEIVIKVRDVLGNIYTHEKINITKIDKEEPIIESITGNPTDWVNERVTLSINGAEDVLGGLAEMPYSFDGGETWQAENTKTYETNTSGIVIQVRDALENIYTHETIDITKMRFKYKTLEDGTIEIVKYIGGESEVVIPSIIEGKEVVSIGDSAFYKCNSLTTIEIPEQVTNIGKYAFMYCRGLISIEIPKGVESIKDSTFRGCSNLASIGIQEGIKNIENTAFAECRSLTSIEIPSTVTTIASSAFWDCSNLTTINVAEKNENYCSINGVLFDKEMMTIICYPAGKQDEEYVIMQGITSIGDYAFSDSTKLKSVIMPEGITNIGYGAFQSSDNLTNIVIPEGVTKIRGATFSHCFSLTSIAIPKGVISIANDAFAFCNNLTIYCNSNSIAEEHAGYHSSISCIVDDESPIINAVTGNPEDWTTENVTLTINEAEDELSGLASKPYSFDGGETWQAENTKTYEENTSGIVIKVKDNLNNIYSHEEINITKIDKVAPTIESVEGNPEEWTKESVTLTINAKDELSGLAEMSYSFDGGETWQAENTKTYEENISGIVIKVRDNLDNIYTHEVINITKIDKVAPTIESVEGNPEEWTKESVTLTISRAKDELSGLAEMPYSFDGGETWQAENTKTYEENTSGIVIKVKDKAENITTHEETINITKIDKVAPTIERVEGNPEEWTKENVILTINGAEDSLSGLAEMPYSFDGGETWQAENRKTYEENTSGIVIKVRDNLGNTHVHQEINITKIDKIAPTIESVEGNPEEWTTKDVILTINAKDELSGLADMPYSFDGGATWQNENTKTYVENTAGIVIKVRDRLGNVSTSEAIDITKIRRIEKIEVTTLPAKTEYKAYENFEITEMIITVTYDNEDQEETTDYTVVNGNNLTCLTQKIEIQHNEDSEIKTEVPIAVSHAEVIDARIEPTCTATGLTEGKHCSVCNTVIVSQHEIDALGHNHEAQVTAPTCTEKGYTTHTCTRCDDKYVDTYTDSLRHSFTNYISDDNATCTEDGTKTAKCDRCEATDTVTDTDSKKPHTEVIDAKVEPTCTATGLTEGKHCSVCNTVTVKQEEIPALGHNHEAQVTAPTCTEKGYTTHTCTRCNDTYVDTYIDSLGHSFTNYVANNDATCIQDGTETAKCDRCDVTDTKLQEGSRLSHNYENGTCTGCGEKEPTLEITTETYNVQDSYITKIQVNTTVKDLKENIQTNATEVNVYNKNNELQDETSALGTGMTVEFKFNNKIYTYTIVVSGDTDGDGEVKFRDMSKVNKHRLNKTKLEGAYLLAADVTGDGEVNFRDLVRINKFRLKKITEL